MFGKEVIFVSALNNDLIVSLDEILDRVQVDEDDLEDEIETAQRAIAW